MYLFTCLLIYLFTFLLVFVCLLKVRFHPYVVRLLMIAAVYNTFMLFKFSSTFFQIIKENIFSFVLPGVGMASIVVSFLVCIYYNVIIAWCLYFLAISLRSEVLWKHCNNWWNTENCYEGRLPDTSKQNCSYLVNATINATASNVTENCNTFNTKDLTSPSLEFWK